MEDIMNFLIVTGLSGSGKSGAVNALEDIGYYCIDNIPPQLIPKFADICVKSHGHMSKVAIVTDIRGGELFYELDSSLDYLRKSGLEVKVLFLDASDEVLIKRYKETRRSHPLAGDGVSVAEALQKERILLQPVRDHADYVLDTSGFSTTKLHAEILNLFSDATLEDGMHVNVLSFGFKNGIPVEADLVMDVRFMPNPYYIEDLKRKTGLDDAVRDYVFSFSQTNDFMKRMEDLLSFLLPLYSEEGKTILVIGIGCTGGHHRSVAVAHALSEYIQSIGYPVTEIHRDITR